MSKKDSVSRFRPSAPCPVSPDCLTCPRHICLHDEPNPQLALAQDLADQRNRETLELVTRLQADGTGEPVAPRAAALLGVAERTILRRVARAREA